MMLSPTASARAEQAARNNARWCDTICRAHSRLGEFLDDLWLCRQETPRFYPNVVTLSRARGSAAQLAYIQELMALEIASDWAVKDSFCSLDLAPLAFRLLFEAAWIWRSPALPAPDDSISGVRWASVCDPLDLAAWETAWSGPPADDQSTALPRIFLPALLADDTIAVIAAYQGQRIIAGAIVNHTENVVGLSNVFGPADTTAQVWAGCVAAAIAAFPGLPLVGYEGGRDLAVAQVLGFEVLEPLRVWLRS
jgi:hypothetical protein